MVLGHLPDLLADVPRPAVLELGGRRVTPDPWQPPEHWRRLGLDVRPGPGVDLVADAHRLAEHLEPESLDGFYSHAVFEHLAMPWAVVLQLNRVLRTGALGWIVTHEAFPLHEWPWDFWRFGPGCWDQLFSPRTGFELLGARPLEPGTVIPDHDPAGAYPGHLGCEVQVRRTGPADPALRWDLSAAEVLPAGHRYPGGLTRVGQRLGRAWHRLAPARARPAGADPWGLLGTGADWLVLHAADRTPPADAESRAVGPDDDWQALLADVPDGSRQGVALLDALGTVPCPWRAAEPLRRVLAEGARLVVDDRQVAPAERPGWRLSSEGLAALFHPAAGFVSRRRGHAEPAAVQGPGQGRGRARAWQRTLGLFEARGSFDAQRMAW